MRATDWVVIPATWAVARTLGRASRGLAGSGGSWAKTSSPAPAIVPPRRASRRAPSSTSSPRAVLIR